MAQHLHGERASAEQWRAPRRSAAEAGTLCALSAGERRGLHRGCAGGCGKEEGGREVLGESRGGRQEMGWSVNRCSLLSVTGLLRGS